MSAGVQVNKTKLKYVRAEIGLTQVQLAERAGVAEKTLVSAEQGKSIQALSAAAILHALNAERVKRGRSNLNMADLDWKIQGD